MSKLSASSNYIIPICHLQGSLADMLFWDATYYLLQTQGQSNSDGHRYVETNYAELQTLTGLTRKTLRKQIDQAIAHLPPYQIREEAGIAPQSWVLKHYFYEDIKQGKRIQKPIELMRNSWGWVLAQPYLGHKKSSRFPLAILNILLRKPTGRTTTIQELSQRVRKSTSHSPPDIIHIQRALAHLENLGLIDRDDSGYWVAKEQFRLNGRSFYENLTQTAITPSNQNDLIQWGNQVDTVRTQTTLEIMDLGQFETTHFKEIFQSLTYIQRDTDLDWLRYAVHRHRHRPQGRQRWQNCWQLFQNTLHKQAYGTTSEKIHIDLSQHYAHNIQLSLPPHEANALRWCKLVIWVRDGRFLSCGMGRAETVQINVWHQHKPVWQREVSYEDEIVRCDLTAVMRQASEPSIKLHVVAPTQLPQFSFDFILEAQYLPRRKTADAS